MKENPFAFIPMVTRILVIVTKTLLSECKYGVNKQHDQNCVQLLEVFERLSSVLSQNENLVSFVLIITCRTLFLSYRILNFKDT